MMICKFENQIFICSKDFWLNSCSIFYYNIIFLYSKSQNFRKTVRLGEHKVSHTGKDCSPRNRFDCNLGHQDFEIENITVHPDYNFRTIKNDIAIIQLNRKITPNCKF